MRALSFNFDIMLVLMSRYGADPDVLSPKGWSPLSYAKARGKYGPTEEKGIYPEVRQTDPLPAANTYYDINRRLPSQQRVPFSLPALVFMCWHVAPLINQY